MRLCVLSVGPCACGNYFFLNLRTCGLACRVCPQGHRVGLKYELEWPRMRTLAHTELPLLQLLVWCLLQLWCPSRCDAFCSCCCGA